MREAEVDWPVIYTIAFDPKVRTQDEGYRRYREQSRSLPSQSTVLRALSAARAVVLFVLPGHIPADRLTDVAHDPLKQGEGWQEMNRLAQGTRYPSLVSYVEKKRVTQALEAWARLPAGQQAAVRQAAEGAWVLPAMEVAAGAAAAAPGAAAPGAGAGGPAERRPQAMGPILVYAGALLAVALPTGAIAITWGYVAALGTLLGGGLLAGAAIVLIRRALPGTPGVTAVGPQPLIGSLRKQLVIVSGHHFMPGCRVTLLDGNGVPFILRPEQVRVVNARRMDLTVGLDTLPDTWTIQITNPDGRISPAFRFDVLAAPNPGPPLLTAAVPSQVQVMAQPQELRLQGSGFMRGVKVLLLAGGRQTVLHGEEIHLRDSLNLTVRARFYPAADRWLVEVENPNGQKSNYLFLDVAGG